MKKNSFIEGTIFAYVIILLTKILGAVYVIPFYKIIGENGGILYSYAYNVYNLFLNISTSGIPTAVSIIIAEYSALKMYKEREFTYKTANRVIACISFIAFLAMFIFAKPFALFFIGDIEDGISIESIVLVIRVISFCLLIVPFLSVTRGYLQGNKYVSVSSFSQLIEQVVRIIIVLVGSYVAINLLSYSVPVGIAVALSGTVLGAFAAYIFLKIKIHRHRDELNIAQNKKALKISTKDVIQKIILYAIPIIIVSITQNIYEWIDLKFIIKGLYMVGYSGTKSEYLASVIITWAPKICMVINALAMGLCTSIIPFVVSSYVNKNYDELNIKFNQAINTIIFISLPLAAFLTIFSSEIYYIFYGYNHYGSIILKMLSLVSIFFSIQMVVNMILQGMKKYKIVYINSIAGILVNALCDIPLILLLNKLHFYPYLGTLMSTLLGIFVSMSIVFIALKKEFNFKYHSIIINLLKTILLTAFVMLIMYGLNYFILPVNGYIITLMILFVFGLITMGIYMLLAYKIGLINQVFGDDFLPKILKKLKLKK